MLILTEDIQVISKENLTVFETFTQFYLRLVKNISKNIASKLRSLHFINHVDQHTYFKRIFLLMNNQ